MRLIGDNNYCNRASIEGFLVRTTVCRLFQIHLSFLHWILVLVPDTCFFSTLDFGAGSLELKALEKGFKTHFPGCWFLGLEKLDSLKDSNMESTFS